MRRPARSFLVLQAACGAGSSTHTFPLHAKPLERHVETESARVRDRLSVFTIGPFFLLVNLRFVRGPRPGIPGRYGSSQPGCRKHADATPSVREGSPAPNSR